MSLERVDCVVIGAGVVGLAAAYSLARAGREVVILEQADTIGQGISSRNSEVIHAGIYYPKNSLKARFCVAGNKLLYRYCESHQVAFKRCGKLIVATSADQLTALKQIQQRAAANGVVDLEWLTGLAVSLLEPEIRCEAALLSPSTGVVDTHGLMLSLLGDAEQHGAVLAVDAHASSISQGDQGLLINVDGDQSMTLYANSVVNSAGFGAINLARKNSILSDYTLPTQVLAKGNYFGMQGRAAVSRLIYPIPEPGGLGVHITLDLAGQIRFGPDVEWVDDVDYKVNPSRSASFYAAIRDYYPGLMDDSLVPDYAGLRPKISINAQIQDDFIIDGPQDHGVSGLVNLFGIESPGLTSSLAIGDHISKLLVVQ